MQVRARRFVCTTTFIRCISICFQFSAILTEVRAKLALVAYKPSALVELQFKFLLEKQLSKKKRRKLEANTNQYTLALVFGGFYRGQLIHRSAQKTVRSRKVEKCIQVHLLSFLSGFC